VLRLFAAAGKHLQGARWQGFPQDMVMKKRFLLEQSRSTLQWGLSCNTCPKKPRDARPHDACPHEENLIQCLCKASLHHLTQHPCMTPDRIRNMNLFIMFMCMLAAPFHRKHFYSDVQFSNLAIIAFLRCEVFAALSVDVSLPLTMI